MRLYEQYLTKNECYQIGQPLIPTKLILHSTGADNPNVNRYVPMEGSGDSHWDQFRPGGRQVCVHAFIGRLPDGSIGTVQTLPWDMRGWHAGKSKGNSCSIGVEICEDDLTDEVYFKAVYHEAVELFAMLCQEFDLDPKADILCHSEAYKKGLASNHADVRHWFSKFGKNMDDFRADVARELEGGEDMTQEQFDAFMENWLARQAEKPVSSWAEKLLEEAKARGITDGTRPQAFATRQEVALMVHAGTK